jgi:phage protein D
MAEGTSNSATSYTVKLGDQEFTQPEKDGLESIVIEDHVDMVEMMTLKIGGGEGQPEWKAEIGQTVEVYMGEESKVLFKGEVTSLEPSWAVNGITTLSIRALDNCHRLARGRKTRWFEKKKDSEVAQTVGAEANLSVDADETETTHDYILQRNESNYAFLKRLAARNNFILAVDEGKLLFKKAETSGSATTITMGKNLRSLRMNFNSMDQVSKVVVRGWDIREKKEIVGTCEVGEVETIGGGQIGGKLSSEKFGDSVAYITDVPVASQDQANEVAKAEMNRLARQFGKGTCVVEGSDSLRAGAVVEFSGLQTGHNGNFYIISSRHTITAHAGYLTELTFCSNTLGS